MQTQEKEKKGDEEDERACSLLWENKKKGWKNSYLNMVSETTVQVWIFENEIFYMNKELNLTKKMKNIRNEKLV